MKKILVSLLSFIYVLTSSAQCPLKNTAFQHGEKLTYEMYFNWNFVWMKAGTAIFLTSKSVYQGKDAFRSYLITRTSTTLDEYFCMRDTLTAMFTDQNVPLYYRKGANEGGKYRRDEVWYSYPDGNCHITQRYQNPSGKVTTQEHTQKECVYDMMTLMQRARSMNPSDFKVGEKKYFKMADGDDIDNVYVVYRGTEKTELKSNKKKYRCLVFSFMEDEDGKSKEIIRFFITDDANHMPVRLDMYLKFGTAKAYLLSAEGLRNPCTSLAK